MPVSIILWYSSPVKLRKAVTVGKVGGGVAVITGMANSSLPNFTRGDGECQGQSLAPRRHAFAPERLVAQVGGGRGTYPRADRGARLAVVADGVDPVLQVQQLAVGLRIEIAAARQLRVENLFFRLELREAGLRGQLKAAAVDVHGAFAAHELDHGAVAGVAEGALEVHLQVVAIAEERLDGVGRLPDIASSDEVADGDGLLGMFEVEHPVGDVEPVDHEVGEDAVAEIPEPAPVAELVVVEVLRRGVAEKAFAVEALDIDVLWPAADPVRVAVPGHVDLVHRADAAGVDQLLGADDVRHRALLRADLDDAAVLFESADDLGPFAHLVRE